MRGIVTINELVGTRTGDCVDGEAGADGGWTAMVVIVVDRQQEILKLSTTFIDGRHMY